MPGLESDVACAAAVLAEHRCGPLRLTSRGCAQIQYSLLDRRPENSMLEFCQQNGIKLLPFGTVAGGLLSDKYLGASADKCEPCHG